MKISDNIRIKSPGHNEVLLEKTSLLLAFPVTLYNTFTVLLLFVLTFREVSNIILLISHV
jgi:hypothetical protein